MEKDLFVKILCSLATAAAIKMSADLGEIKTTVAVAVQRIEQHESRLTALEASTLALARL